MQIHGPYAQNADSVDVGYGLDIYVLNKYLR